MSDWIDRLDDSALLAHLSEVAREREAQLRVEERADEWRAEIIRETSLGTEGVVYGVEGQTRRQAMERLAQVAAA
jgi:hypothetical protein